MTGDEGREMRVIAETITFYRQSLEWLAKHHAAYGQKTTHDLLENERHNAVWKLSGQSIAHATALVDLLELGYTGQTWPLMRAIHEVDRLLVAVTDVEEETIVRRWLADQQVKQAKARAAEQRQAKRISEQMQAAGDKPIEDDVGALSQQVYKLMSKAAHHQRSIVDEAVDHDSRAMIYGPDPRVERRLEYLGFGGLLIQEVLLLVGDALSFLWGPPFYQDHLAPMLERFATVLDGLDTYKVLKRFGSA
jgi:hypothetical protein